MTNTTQATAGILALNAFLVDRSGKVAEVLPAGLAADRGWTGMRRRPWQVLRRNFTIRAVAHVVGCGIFGNRRIIRVPASIDFDVANCLHV